MSKKAAASRYRRISATRPHKSAASVPPKPALAAEGAARYEQPVDLTSDSSQARVVRLVGQNKDVLELGCSTGYMSRVLRERGCRVVAVEQDAGAAERAQCFCEHVIVGDLEQLDLGDALGKARFDVIVAADVLEHLKDPVRLLRALRGFLKDDGWLVASLPNVAHGSVRLALLGGEFAYRPMGLLDRTHLRFFTRDTLQGLFNDAGFIIGHLERREMPLDDSEVTFDRAAVPSVVLEAMSRDREALTYQFIVVAHALPRKHVELIQGMVRSAAVAQETAEARSRQAAEENRALEDRVRELQEQSIAADTEVRRLAHENRTLHREVQELGEARNAADTEARRLAQENEGLHRKAEDLEAEQRATEVRFRELTRERGQAQSGLEAATRTSISARQELERLQLILAEKTAHLAALAERLQDLAAREIEARGLLHEAHARLRVRDEQLAARRGLEADLSAHRETIASLRAEHAETQARMAGMRRTRVWRVGTVYWWIEARVKSLLRL
jgi:2-polyprenyl-3-methyl-5-hydroxy-6-metoxy-1,4-benzoquinol methylase